MKQNTLETWAILELMGHRKLAGFLTEQEIAGHGFLRLDVPRDGGTDTQFYAPSAVYCMTPTTEEIARAYAARNQPRPVEAWQLPELRQRSLTAGGDVEAAIVDDEDGVAVADLEAALRKEDDEDEDEAPSSPPSICNADLFAKTCPKHGNCNGCIYSQGTAAIVECPLHDYASDHRAAYNTSQPLAAIPAPSDFGDDVPF